jgi:hypothetical protein
LRIRQAKPTAVARPFNSGEWYSAQLQQGANNKNTVYQLLCTTETNLEATKQPSAPYIPFKKEVPM